MANPKVGATRGEYGCAGADAELVEQVRRRRCFAVISHPDAGKSTLTEALALNAKVISRVGAVRGKPGRRGVLSDWLGMERARGISITSAALRFDYHGTVINLVDTPGHADFSEDTYRAVSAADSAVMLLDAAKGVESRTLKLFEVCRYRDIPVITFVNKWDRPGREPLRLCDELFERTGLLPMPVAWPVGQAGCFRGLLDGATGRWIREQPPASTAHAAREANMAGGAIEAEDDQGIEWRRAREELELLVATTGALDHRSFVAGRATPVLFGAALRNIGVRALLAALLEWAPGPSARRDVRDIPRPLDAPFSGFVFKVQAGMDPAHRDRVAFVRVCSGRFERGMVLTQARTGRQFATKYAHQFLAQQRTTLDSAYPGDIVGLVNATALRVGDTLYAGKSTVAFPPLPSFAPDYFAIAHVVDHDRSKQFRRGIELLDQEGVVQVLRSERRGLATPVLAAVGPLQFQVAEHRLHHECGVAIRWQRLSYTTARRLLDPQQRPLIEDGTNAEVLRRDRDGVELALFTNQTSLEFLVRRHPHLRLEYLPATS